MIASPSIEPPLKPGNEPGPNDETEQFSSFFAIFAIQQGGLTHLCEDSANAMVLASSESGTNTADPRIGLALNHIGIANNGQSGVYLGNYQGKSWVLTANQRFVDDRCRWRRPRSQRI